MNFHFSQFYHSLAALHTLEISQLSAVEIDTFCGKVKWPFWFAQPNEAMAHNIGQGSQAPMAHV